MENVPHFAREYASFIKRECDDILDPDVRKNRKMEISEKVDKIIRLKDRGLISIGETMMMLTRLYTGEDYN